MPEFNMDNYIDNFVMEREQYMDDKAAKEKLTNQRYCIVGDDSGHDYVIPVDKELHWNFWLDECIKNDSWTEVPEYAIRTEGNLTFTDPKV